MNFHRVNDQWGYPSKVAPVEFYSTDEEELEYLLALLEISVEVIQISGHFDEFLIYSEDFRQYNRARHEISRTFGNVRVSSVLPVPSLEEFDRMAEIGRASDFRCEILLSNAENPRASASAYYRVPPVEIEEQVYDPDQPLEDAHAESQSEQTSSNCSPLQRNSLSLNSLNLDEFVGGQAIITLVDNQTSSFDFDFQVGAIRGIDVHFDKLRIGFKWILETDKENYHFDPWIPTVQAYPIRACANDPRQDCVHLELDSGGSIQLIKEGHWESIDLEEVSRYRFKLSTEIIEPIDFGDDLRLFWNRETGDAEEFQLNEVDLIAIETMNKLLRITLTHSSVKASQVVTIGKALEAVEGLPVVPEFSCEVGVSYISPRPEGYRKFGVHIMIGAFGFSIKWSGCLYTEGVGHDTISEPGYEFEGGSGSVCECDLYHIIEEVEDILREDNVEIFTTSDD